MVGWITAKPQLHTHPLCSEMCQQTLVPLTALPGLFSWPAGALCFGSVMIIRKTLGWHSLQKLGCTTKLTQGTLGCITNAPKGFMLNWMRAPKPEQSHNAAMWSDQSTLIRTAMNKRLYLSFPQIREKGTKPKMMMWWVGQTAQRSSPEEPGPKIYHK